MPTRRQPQTFKYKSQLGAISKNSRKEVANNEFKTLGGSLGLEDSPCACVVERELVVQRRRRRAASADCECGQSGGRPSVLWSLLLLFCDTTAAAAAGSTRANITRTPHHRLMSEADRSSRGGWLFRARGWLNASVAAAPAAPLARRRHPLVRATDAAHRSRDHFRNNSLVQI